MELPAAFVALLLLGWLWVTATRRHHRRRTRDADWGGAARPDLWTSGAACPNCGKGGAVISVDDDQDGPFRHSCLACGHEHRRRHPG